MADKKKKLVPTTIISEELLKLYSPLSKNIGTDKVIPFVILAQDFYIAPILGNPLLTQLQLEVDNGMLTEENKALLIKVAAPLALYSTYLAMRSVAYTISEKGLTKEKSENSESLNADEIGDFRLDLKNQAEMAEKILIKYLCGCSDLYPLWRPENDCECSKLDDGDGSAHKVKDSFMMYFPNGNNNECGCNDNFIKKDVKR